MNQRKIGVVLSYLHIFSNIFINFAYIPILIFYIGKSEYGLYQLLGSVIGYFMLMDFGLSTTVVRFYMKYKVLNDDLRKENLLAISLGLYGIISLVVVAIGTVFYFYIEDVFAVSMSNHEIFEAKRIYILLLLNIVISFFGYVFTAIISAHEKFVFLKSVELFQTILKPIIAILIIQVHPYAFYVVLTQSFLNVILILVKIWYCLNRLKVKIKYYFFDKELLLDFARLSTSVFVVAIVDRVFYQTNQIILGIFYGTDVVAVYSIAALVCSNYMVLSTAISGILSIRATEIAIKSNNVKEILELFIKYGRIQFVILGFVLTAFMCFGQMFIKLWLGEGYLEAYWMGVFILFPMTVDLIQNIIFSVMQVRNQYGFRAKLYTCMAIVNIALAIPAAKIYGGIGCSFVTGLVLLVGNGLCLNIYFQKKLKLEIKEYWRNILKISMVMSGAVLSIEFIQSIYLASSWFNFGIVVAFYGVIYSTFIWKFALNMYEKNIFKSILKR